MTSARWHSGILSAVAALLLASGGVEGASPLVVCSDQTYALCAEATCFSYNNVAYCKCDVLTGDSISVAFRFSGPSGPQDVCDVNEQGATNGFMVSTFSLPPDAVKGGPTAVYTCPGKANKGAGVAAPVAYGQCDGGICFKSSSGNSFPGFDTPLQSDEIICACPIALSSTPGSTNPFGYQVFGSYHPTAPPGQRCDPSGCAACSIAPSTGAIIPVGAPTGSGRLLTALLSGAPAPALNQCLCTCSQDSSGNTSCVVGQDTTP